MFVKIIRADPQRVDSNREREREQGRERKRKKTKRAATVPFTGAGGERGVVNV